jgi:hypothetical protein
MHIVSVMGDNLEDAELQGLGCWVLGNLASNSANNSAAIARAGGVQYILAASREHVRDASIQMAALWALWNLSMNSELSRGSIRSTRGIDQILVAMKQHLQEPHVQLYACGALWRLAADENQRQSVADAGAIDSIIEAVIEHPDSERLRAQACGALRDLTSSAALHNEPDNAIIASFWNSRGHQAAFEKTKGLVGAPWNLDIGDAHKEWLKTLVDTPLAIVAQCRVLWNSTSDKKHNDASRVWTEGVSRLLAAMDKHPMNHTAHQMRRLEH